MYLCVHQSVRYFDDHADFAVQPLLCTYFYRILFKNLKFLTNLDLSRLIISLAGTQKSKPPHKISEDVVQNLRVPKMYCESIANDLLLLGSNNNNSTFHILLWLLSQTVWCGVCVRVPRVRCTVYV